MDSASGQTEVERLPGLHIRYDDELFVHLVFDGIDVKLGPHAIREISDISADKTVRHGLSRYISLVYKKERSMSRSEEFCDLMTSKVVQKIRRLPHTNVWLLHHS